MPFAIKNKETGELYTGPNWKAPKYYSTRGAANGAMTNCVVNGGRAQQMIGISWKELEEQSKMNVVPTMAQINEAEEAYRRAQYDFKGDWNAVKPFGDAVYNLRRNRTDTIMKNRRNIIKSLMKWEVVEV
jgi:hypothetical protein